MDKTLDKIVEKFGLTSFDLKIIASISMIVDHTGIVLFADSPYYTFFRLVGRIGFPIYCLLLTEGFIHTRNVKKYAIRLAIFALISEVPFDLMKTGQIFSLKYQNSFFALLTGLLMLWWYKWFTDKGKAMIAIIGVPVFMWIAYFIRADYFWFGILLMFIFYIFRENKMHMAFFQGLTYVQYGGLVKYSLASLVPLLLYNGKKGRSMKYFFYAYYPVHMLILFGIKYCIDNFAK